VLGGEAYIFNCADAAATPQGCWQQVTSTPAPRPSYFVDVRYPFTTNRAVMGELPVGSWQNGSGTGLCSLHINQFDFILREHTSPSTFVIHKSWGLGMPCNAGG